MQLDLAFRRNGGARRGAGRPARGPRPSEPHKARPQFSKPLVAHCTLRVVDAVRPLRRPAAYHAVRGALGTLARRGDFRITQLSLEIDHVHALTEANTHTALAKGM